MTRQCHMLSICSAEAGRVFQELMNPIQMITNLMRQALLQVQPVLTAHIQGRARHMLRVCHHLQIKLKGYNCGSGIVVKYQVMLLV